jgi:cell division septum initiation protein DivIVA
MARVEENLESMVSETENAIQEYREKIRQALEKDSNKLKERAERDSVQIIARAHDEADQILRKAREEAAASQQESARVISETKEKASQIIKEVIERGTTQTQRELAQAASEARSKTAQLLAQVNKNVDQIIAETEANIKAELERLANTAAQAETKLHQLSDIHKVSDTRNKGAEVNSRRATSETVIPLGPATEKVQSAAPSVEEKRSVSNVKDSDENQLFKGSLKLEIGAVYNQERLEGVPDWLYRIPGLKFMSTDVYTRANRWVTAYVIELDKPMYLVKILKAIPQLKDVSDTGKYCGDIG